jgi:hypothetical protein
MTTWVLIGLAAVAIWFYGKTAAAKATQAQSPQLTVPQGSVAQSILSSLGVAANLTPSLSATQAVASGAAAPGIPIVSGPAVGLLQSTSGTVTTQAGVPVTQTQSGVLTVGGLSDSDLALLNNLGGSTSDSNLTQPVIDNYTSAPGD